MSLKLTKRAIDALDPPAIGTDFHFDTDVRGFGLRITAGDARTFIWQGRIFGKKARMKIGRFGDITVEEARNIARSIAGEVAAGKDPRAEKKRRETATLTLSKAFENYLTARALKESTREDVKRGQKKIQDWMSKPVVDITRDMVARRHRKIGQKSPSQANLVMRYLRAVLNHASESHLGPDGRPLLIDNPVNVLSATKSWHRLQPRRSYLKPHELQPWMSAVEGLTERTELKDASPQAGRLLKCGATARDFFMLLLLTGLRRSEALNLRWGDVDIKGKTLTIPDPKNHQPHTLPLSDHLHEMLKQRAKASSSQYVFADADGQRFTNLRYPLKRVEQVSGLSVSCHDLRRTFATVAESLDIPAYAVKALLNHKTGGDVTAGYIQITPERLRQPMQRITDYFLRAGEIRSSNITSLKEHGIQQTSPGS